MAERIFVGAEMQLRESDIRHPDIGVGIVRTDPQRFEFVALGFLGMTMNNLARPIARAPQQNSDSARNARSISAMLGPRGWFGLDPRQKARPGVVQATATALD